MTSMLATIGAHFPILVIAAMATFAVTLAGVSIDDAVRARAGHR